MATGHTAGEKWRSVFVSETPFHGFSYVAAADHRFTRFFWVSIMIVCACGMTYQTGLAINVFMEGRISTDYTVAQKLELKLPDVVFCIPARFDRVRMEEAGISEDLMDFAAMGFVFGALPHALGVDPYDYMNFSKATAQIGEFYKIINSGKNYSQLVEEVVFDCTDIISSCYEGGSISPDNCCKNASRFYGKHGLCWEMPGPVQTTSGQGSGLMMRLQLPKERYFYGPHSMFYKGIVMQFAFNHYADSDVVAIPEGSRTQIAVDATHGKYLHTSVNPCEQDPDPVLVCVAKCINEMESSGENCHCRAIDVPQARNETGHEMDARKPCTPWELYQCAENFTYNAFDDGTQACMPKCAYPCDIWQYGKTVSSYRIDADAAKRYSVSGWDEEKTVVLDIYYSSLQMVEIQQYKAMTVVDLFGIIGGLSGLWLGGSIVAVTHLVCFWIRGLCKQNPTEVELG